VGGGRRVHLSGSARHRYFPFAVDRPLSPPVHEVPGPALKGETRLEEPDRLQRFIGRRAAEIRATVPDLELSVDVDAGSLVAAAERQRVSTTSLVIGACAAALKEVPRANAGYRDGRFELYSRVNVAFMLEGPSAQVAATLLDADRRSPAELDAELSRLRARAGAGELTPPEQAGATFTLIDVGVHGVHRAVPLIPPPQAAAVTVGAVRPAPVVRDGAVTAGHTLALTLACDHRILFGAEAARFLTAIARGLETGG
jgi:pyruvate dehydrogenase E2 component (dihydrolipoyllysine-residue acetyltransferase)